MSVNSRLLPSKGLITLCVVSLVFLIFPRVFNFSSRFIFLIPMLVSKTQEKRQHVGIKNMRKM